MAPKNWPKRLIYSPVAVPINIHPHVLRLCLSTCNPDDLKKICPCIAEKRVHKSLKIQKISALNRPHRLLAVEKELQQIQYGLFASKKISKEDELGEYTGRVSFVHKESELSSTHEEHGRSRYCWLLKFNNHLLLIDAQKVANEMALVNDYRGISEQPNAKAKWMIHQGSYYFGYAALRDIEAGEEIVVDYGKKYWESFAER